jgi:dihydrodipicolinate synthase/N-acetylneuraminate lyase
VNGVSTRLLARLVDQVPTMVGIKCSRPDAQVIREMVDVLPPEMVLLAGNERIALGSLALGAAGLISGLATAIPEPFVALTEALKRGDLASARAAQRTVNRLLDQLPPGQRIGAVKAILAQRGIAAGPPVPPRPMPDGKRLWAALEPLL